MIITIICMTVFIGYCYYNINEKISRLSNKIDNLITFIDLKIKTEDLQLNINEMREVLDKRGGGGMPNPPPTPPKP